MWKIKAVSFLNPNFLTSTLKKLIIKYVRKKIINQTTYVVRLHELQKKKKKALTSGGYLIAIESRKITEILTKAILWYFNKIT